MEARRFTSEDYALFHPGGALGRRLLLRVSDVMRSGSAMAVVRAGCSSDGCALCDHQCRSRGRVRGGRSRRIAGIITDGDVRRALIKDEGALS